MGLWELLFGLIVLWTIYEVIALVLKRYERLKAMQKLEGEELTAYLGKAEPQDSDSLKKSRWWIMRIGSLALGIGIAFVLFPVLELLGRDISSEYGDITEILVTGAITILGSLMLLIELFIEHKMRK